MPLRIETVAIDKLTEDPKNARAHDRRNIDAIKGSLERFGQVEPLVVREETGMVVGGNGRLVAMKELGWDKTKVVRLKGLSNEDAAALGLALNRTAELASWDGEALNQILLDLPDSGASLEGLGFELGELRLLTGSNVDMTDFAKPPELDEDSGVPNRAAPNRSWFYVEYYDDEDFYNKLLGAFLEMGGMKPNTKHELTPEAFKEMADLWLKKKRDDASRS